jgi:hypothetical protein
MVNSCQKGKRGEREARDVLNAIFGTHCRRGQQFCGRPDSPDIANFIPEIHLEVKNVKNLQLKASLQQAKTDSGEHEIPIVMWKRPNSSEWFWIVPIEAMPKLAALLHQQIKQTINSEAYDEAVKNGLTPEQFKRLTVGEFLSQSEDEQK